MPRRPDSARRKTEPKPIVPKITLGERRKRALLWAFGKDSKGNGYVEPPPHARAPFLGSEGLRLSPVGPDSARFITPEIFDRTAYMKNYNRGWATSKRPSPRRGFESSLDRADDRNEVGAWYDGYLDYATGREKWHGPEGRRKEVAHTRRSSHAAA